jgi:hypothetical protein
MEIDMGLEGSNCVRIPETGIRRIMVPAELKRIPVQSTLDSLSLADSFGIVDFGRRIKRKPAMHIARGAINQKVARQVAFFVNPAARKGPMVFPRPTKAPKMPWYLCSIRELET